MEGKKENDILQYGIQRVVEETGRLLLLFSPQQFMCRIVGVMAACRISDGNESIHCILPRMM